LAFLPPAIGIEILGKVTLLVEQAYPTSGSPVAGGFEVITCQNALSPRSRSSNLQDQIQQRNRRSIPLSVGSLLFL